MPWIYQAPACGRVNHVTAKEANDAPDVVLGTLFANSLSATVLFDSGVSHSFIKKSFVVQHHFVMHTLQPPYQIRSPGSVFQTDQVCRDVKMKIQGINFLANLIVITAVGIDVILGMDCLSKNQGQINYAQQSISVTSKNGDQVVFAPLVGNFHLYALEAGTSLELEKVPVVCEYPNVFPEELPGMPLIEK